MIDIIAIGAGPVGLLAALLAADLGARTMLERLGLARIPQINPFSGELEAQVCCIVQGDSGREQSRTWPGRWGKQIGPPSGWILTPSLFSSSTGRRSRPMLARFRFGTLMIPSA